MNNDHGNTPRNTSPQNARRPASRTASGAQNQSRPTGARPPRSTGGERRPADAQVRRPVSSGGNRPSGTGQSGQRSTPPQRQTSRPLPPRGYASPRRRKNDELLVYVAIALAVILVAFIVTYVILIVDSPEGDAGTESTPEPSESAGIGDPPDDPVTPEWLLFPSDPKSTKPISDSSTVTLSSSELYSKNVIMVDTSTGKVVCEYGADTRIYPASMTKIMTAIVACELIEDMNDTFVLTNEIIHPLTLEGASMAHFKVNNPIPMIDLIYGAMLPSGADATAGLAIALAGSETEFVKLMNKKALDMGCYGTHFTNASGLHNEDHYSTVRDMAAIMAYARSNPFLKRVMSSLSYDTVAPLTSEDSKTIYCTWSASLASYKSDRATMFAAKTGYTPEAGNCLASISRGGDGKEYIIVSAGAFYSDEISGKNQVFADAKYLCDNYIK